MSAQKPYKNNFVLEESKLSSLVEAMRERLLPLNAKITEKFDTFHKDGSNRSFSKAEEVVKLHNSSKQKVTKLITTFAVESGTQAEHSVTVVFDSNRPFGNAQDFKTIYVDVKSPSTSWSTGVLAEVEFQIERTFARFATQFAFLSAIAIACLILALSAVPKPKSNLDLGRLYQTMWLTDADLLEFRDILRSDQDLKSEEMSKIYSRQLKNIARSTAVAEEPSWTSKNYVLVLIPASLGLVIFSILIATSPAGVFSWGEQKEKYETRLKIRNEMTKYIILAVIIGTLIKVFLEAALPKFS